MNQPMSRRLVRTLACVSVMALALMVSPASAQGVHVRSRAEELSDTLTTIARTAEPAVVEIFATSYGPTAGPGPRGGELLATQRASGSGVIVDPDGFIVTNAHVVRGAQHLRVTLPSGETGASILAPQRRVMPAQIVGLDAETDLAVLKVNHVKLPFLTFGDSDTLRAGQLVLAVGQPVRVAELGLAGRGQRGGAPADAGGADGLRANGCGHQSGQQRGALDRSRRSDRRYQHAPVLAGRHLPRTRVRGASQYRSQRLRAAQATWSRAPRRHRHSRANHYAVTRRRAAPHPRAGRRHLGRRA